MVQSCQLNYIHSIYIPYSDTPTSYRIFGAFAPSTSVDLMRRRLGRGIRVFELRKVTECTMVNDATSNKGIATRNKKLLGAPGLTTRNKKLLETRS